MSLGVGTACKCGIHASSLNEGVRAAASAAGAAGGLAARRGLRINESSLARIWLARESSSVDIAAAAAHGVSEEQRLGVKCQC
jgi:hypothetical protein